MDGEALGQVLAEHRAQDAAGLARGRRARLRDGGDGDGAHQGGREKGRDVTHWASGGEKWTRMPAIVSAMSRPDKREPQG